MKSIRKFVFIMVALAALLSSCSTDAGDSKIDLNSFFSKSLQFYKKYCRKLSTA